MDLEEAKAKLEITEQERLAVRDYTFMPHSAINSLIGFNMGKYIKSAERGWYIFGMNSDEKKADIELGEEVLSYLGKASLIYSAMIKNAYSNKMLYQLSRGTSVSEVEALREEKICNKILSATTDEDIAQGRFTDPREPAIIRLSVGKDVPFINVNKFLEGMERNGFDQEKEYILSPFAKVTSVNFIKESDGVKFYDVDITKPEMRSFKDGEKDTLSSDIKNNFAEILRKGKALVDIGDRWDALQERILRTESRQDESDMREEQDKLMQEYSEISAEIRAFEEKMHNYVQGLFSEREKELTETREFVKQEEERARVEKMKQIREKRIAELEGSILKLSDIDDLPSSYVSTYESLKEDEKAYADRAKALGIPFNLQLPTQDFDLLLEGIASNIQNIKARVGAVKGQTFEDDSELARVTNEISGYSIKADCVRKYGSKTYEITQEYRDEALHDAKKGVDERVQAIIKSTKLQIIAMKRREVETRKISFWGRLRRLDKLQEAELRNLNLEEQIVKKSPIVEKLDYSIHDSLAELRAFSKRELDGLATEEMIQFNSTVRRYFGVDDSEIERRADTKLRTLMPTVVEPKKKRISTAKKIASANEKTQNLQAELLDIQNTPQNDDIFRTNQSSAISRFTKVLTQVEETLLPNTLLSAEMIRVMQEEKDIHSSHPVDVDWGVK